MKDVYVLGHYRSNQSHIAITAHKSQYDAQKALDAKLKEITEKYGKTHKMQITYDQKHGNYAAVLISGQKIIIQHHLSVTKLKGGDRIWNTSNGN